MNDARAADGTDSKSVWSIPTFWKLFVPSIGVGLEQQILHLALPLLVFQISSSEMEMNIVRAIGFVPNLLLAFFIGAMVDRANKKTWLVAVLAAQVASLAALALLFDLETMSGFLLYPLVFVLSTATYSYYNAQTVALKMAIPQNKLGSAVSVFASIGQAFQLFGPALAGFLLLLPTPSASLWVATAVAALSLLAISTVNLPHRPVPSEKMGKRIRDGWNALHANRPLWLMTLIVIGTNSADGMFGITVLQKLQAIGLSPVDIGLVFSAAGAAGMAGSLVTPKLRQVAGQGPLAAATLLAVALLFGATALTENPVALTAILCVEAFVSTIFVVQIWTLRQETTPVEVIGRVAGVTGSLFKLGMPFAIIGAGFITESSGTTAVFILCALLNLAMFGFLIGSATLRGLR